MSAHTGYVTGSTEPGKPREGSNPRRFVEALCGVPMSVRLRMACFVAASLAAVPLLTGCGHSRHVVVHHYHHVVVHHYHHH